MRNMFDRNRSRFEIMAEILRDLREPTCWTNIMSHCNISSKQSGQYLNLLRSSDLVRIDATAGKVTYQRTEAGRHFLTLYNKIVLLLDPSISAPSLIWQCKELTKQNIGKIREILCSYWSLRATTNLFSERIILTVERWGDRRWVQNRIPVERQRKAPAVTKRGVLKREELVGERNRREGKNERSITIRRQQSTEVPRIPRSYSELFLGKLPTY
jgi:predicted transcriptional regulator